RRIKPGFYADLEILDTDIFTCDPMNIINILPELVMVGGKIVYRK
ncbi:MAG: amidohydrolase family protein, partial [Firmicutes bacterium]|nr:amidohydrolase family protein [Bacillota bacterium]